MNQIRVGIVEGHYLLCPFCSGRADLENHRCMHCGALAKEIIWEGERSTPELISVMRVNNFQPWNR